MKFSSFDYKIIDCLTALNLSLLNYERYQDDKTVESRRKAVGYAKEYLDLLKNIHYKTGIKKDVFFEDCARVVSGCYDFKELVLHKNRDFFRKIIQTIDKWFFLC